MYDKKTRKRCYKSRSYELLNKRKMIFILSLVILTTAILYYLSNTIVIPIIYIISISLYDVIREMRVTKATYKKAKKEMNEIFDSSSKK
ncbi:hypothetical protein [Sulfurimonas sp. NW9]|uniref:hypothetical protein n=1 Tax=Sulfurimonas sp. NW9 TaxID=2922728 RepID=UPI003DA8E967